MKNIAGIVIAMAGVVWYGLIKNAEKQEASRAESAAQLIARTEEGRDEKWTCPSAFEKEKKKKKVGEGEGRKEREKEGSKELCVKV